MDIDETVLDNSEPQAEMLLEGTCFDEFPRPGTTGSRSGAPLRSRAPLEFIRAARGSKDAEGRAVRIFFITNRECAPRAGSDAACPQQDDTLANLEALGLGSATLADDLMLKGERAEWDSEKLARRQDVARTHRIVLNVGDDLADFLPGVRRASVTDRDLARCAHCGLLGPALVPRAEPHVRLLARGARPRPRRGRSPRNPGFLQDCPAP